MTSGPLPRELPVRGGELRFRYPSGSREPKPSSSSGRYAAMVTSVTSMSTGVTTLHKNGKASINHATPVTSSRRRHESLQKSHTR